MDTLLRSFVSVAIRDVFLDHCGHQQYGIGAERLGAAKRHFHPFQTFGYGLWIGLGERCVPSAKHDGMNWNTGFTRQLAQPLRCVEVCHGRALNPFETALFCELDFVRIRKLFGQHS